MAQKTEFPSETSSMDVTSSLHEYRECMRHLWNVSCIPSLRDETEWDIRDWFEDASAIMFRIMVLMPLGSEVALKHSKPLCYSDDNRCLPFLHVSPRNKRLGAKIMVGTATNALENCCWEYLPDLIGPGELDLRFIDLFDFDYLGTRDYEYYRVRISGSKHDAHMAGRDALIRVADATVTFHAIDVDESL